MTDFSSIFLIALVINVFVTSFSLKSCRRWLSEKTCPKNHSSIGASDASRSSSSAESIIDPLIVDVDELSNRSKEYKINSRSSYNQFLTRYLTTYLFATASDWFQGPYVYALYDFYGFSKYDIAVLFVAGYGSSMIFGSFVGGMADKGGRKKYTIVFCISYALSCITKHFNHFWILMIGRILSGISTSLLFSVFDSWLIKAHSVEGFNKNHISESFTSAAYGNSIVAIITGLVANTIASWNKTTITLNSKYIYTGGYLNPFDAALLALILCMVSCLMSWTENYGDVEGSSSHGHSNICGNMGHAFKTTRRNADIMYCGAISSLFEGSMYVFVFMWTPVLTRLTIPDESGNVELPFGVIFATFMVSCMIGTSLFSILNERFRYEAMGIFVFIAGSISFAIISWSPNDTFSFVSMNVFEICVGMYFPIMGTMKSSVVPESERAAIYNLYRIPLNFIVISSLLINLSVTQTFLICSVMLGLASIFQLKLSMRRVVNNPHMNTDEVSNVY